MDFKTTTCGEISVFVLYSSTKFNISSDINFKDTFWSPSKCILCSQPRVMYVICSFEFYMNSLWCVSEKLCEDPSTRVVVGLLFGGIVIGVFVLAAVLAGLKATKRITFTCNRGKLMVCIVSIYTNTSCYRNIVWYNHIQTVCFSLLRFEPFCLFTWGLWF